MGLRIDVAEVSLQCRVILCSFICILGASYMPPKTFYRTKRRRLHGVVLQEPVDSLAPTPEPEDSVRVLYDIQPSQPSTSNDEDLLPALSSFSVDDLYAGSQSIEDPNRDNLDFQEPQVPLALLHQPQVCFSSSPSWMGKLGEQGVN